MIVSLYVCISLYVINKALFLSLSIYSFHIVEKYTLEVYLVIWDLFSEMYVCLYYTLIKATHILPKSFLIPFNSQFSLTASLEATHLISVTGN